ncbi:hypothetical protein FQN49_001128 [Arthroderma sp. PD_2]|nr:hypothetical protein FQN49_001128 [Arthroderma sp. PD_2]
MGSGTTYVQKLPSGKVGFVRHPIKIKSKRSILADAFLPHRDGRMWVRPPYGFNYDPPPIDLQAASPPISPMDGPSQTYHNGGCQLAARQYEPVTSNPRNREVVTLPPVSSPVIEQQSPTYSRVLAATTAETRHRCAVCGRYRSASYQYRHPIIPGQTPHTSVCRKCRFIYTSSDDSTESEGGNGRPRGRRHSRGRRSSSRQRSRKEPSIQPPQPTQIPQAPEVIQPPQPPITRVESSPNIFHFCPNPPGLCTFRSRRNSLDYGLLTPISSPHCCSARIHHSIPDYRDTGSSCCCHGHRHQEPRPCSLRKSKSLDEVQIVPPNSPLRNMNTYSRPVSGDWDNSYERPRKPRSPTRSPSPARGSRRMESYQVSPPRARQHSQTKTYRFAPDETRNLSDAQCQTRNEDPPIRRYTHVLSRGDDQDNGWNSPRQYGRSFSIQPSRDINGQRQPSRADERRNTPETIFIPKARRQFGVRYGVPQPATRQWSYESKANEPESRFRDYHPTSPQRTAIHRPSYTYPLHRDERDAVQGYSDLRNERRNSRHYAGDREIIEGPRGTYRPRDKQVLSNDYHAGANYRTREQPVVW